MQRSRWRSLTVLVCAAAVWLSHAPAATAESGKRIAVLEVEGARNGKLRRALTKLIEEQHRVIGPDAYRRAARRLKAKKLNPDDVAKVAAKVKADAVLHGMLVAEDDESYMFRLRLRDGASGRTVKRLAVRLSEPSLSGKLQYKLGVRLLDAIDDLQAADDEEAIAAVEDVDARPARKKSRSRAIAIREASEDDADEDITEESVSLADDEEASDRGARDSRRDADDEAIRSAEEEPLDDMEPPSEQRVAALADEDEDVDSGSDAKGSSLRATVTRSEPVRVNSAMVQVQAGVSVVQRSLAFTTRQGLENQPAGYSGPPAAGAFASGEMYPLAGGEGLAANVGGAFMIDRVIGLKTLIPGPDGQPLGPPSTTNMQRWSVGVRVRKSFGEHATAPLVKAGVDYGKIEFAIDNPMGLPLDLPNSAYTVVAPGLEVRFPLSEKLAFAAAARGFLVTEAGQITTAEQYGQATVTGGDGEAGFDYLATERLLVSLRARGAAFGFSFSGNGQMTTMRDADPATPDVYGALDRYLGGTATLGYLF